MMGIRSLDHRSWKLSIRSLVAECPIRRALDRACRGRRFVRSGLAAVAASMLPGCGPSLVHIDGARRVQRIHGPATHGPTPAPRP